MTTHLRAATITGVSPRLNMFVTAREMVFMQRWKQQLILSDLPILSPPNNASRIILVSTAIAAVKANILPLLLARVASIPLVTKSRKDMTAFVLILIGKGITLKINLKQKMKKTLEQLLRNIGNSKKLLVGATAATSLLIPLNMACEVEKDDQNNGEYNSYGGSDYNDNSGVPDCIWCGYRKEGESAMYVDNDKCGAGMMCAQTTGGVMCTPDDWSDYTCNPGSGPYYPTILGSPTEEEPPCVDECIPGEYRCKDQHTVQGCGWVASGGEKNCYGWTGGYVCPSDPLSEYICEGGECVKN